MLVPLLINARQFIATLAVGTLRVIVCYNNHMMIVARMDISVRNERATSISSRITAKMCSSLFFVRHGGNKDCTFR